MAKELTNSLRRMTWKSTDSVDGNKAKTILIAGYYGFGNAGDEAILSVILADLRERRDGLKFIIVSGNPADTTASYGVSSVHWQDIDALLDSAQESDLIILGGGGLFQDHWGVPKGTSLTASHWGISFYSAIGMLAALYQKPFMMYSVGVGPITSEEGRRLTRWTFDLANVCTVRDPESKDVLISLGIPEEKVDVVPDPALNFSVASPLSADILKSHGVDPTQTPLLGVCVRNWGDEEAAKRWKRELAAALDQFREAHEAHIIFIPFQVLERALENDHAAAVELTSMMQNQDRITLLAESYPPAVVRGLISHCQLLVGMRLHSLIFAATTGVPAVALVYDPKVANFMESLERSTYTINLSSLTRNELFHLVESAWTRETSTRPVFETDIQKLQRLAQKAPDTVIRLLDRTSTVRSMDVVQDLAIQKTRELAAKEQELRTLLAQMAVKDQEIQTLKGQVNGILHSRSWKLAQLLSQLRSSLIPIGSRREHAARIVYRYSRGVVSAIANGVLSIPQSVSRRGLHRRQIQAETRRFSAILQSILDLHPDAPGVVIFPPTIGWNISLFQRPHQLARAFAQKGFLVFFCTEYSGDDVQGFKEVNERLYLAKGPWKALDLVENPVVLTLPYNREFLSHFRQPHIVYEVIDDLDVFPGDQALLQKNHHSLLHEAEIVLVTADRLMEQVKQIRPDAILCPNAAEVEHFAQAKESDSRPIPPDLTPLLKPGRPVIGYYGALARWFDYDLVRQAAQTHPDWDFVFVGPNHDNTLMDSNILSMTNIHWLGPREYKALPDYLRCFSVATIPFLVNNITLATSPIKLFEYMAGGKPIVTTDMPECRKYPGVFVARNAEEFIRHLEYALTLVNDPMYLTQLYQTAQANTWEARVTQIVEALEDYKKRRSTT